MHSITKTWGDVRIGSYIRSKDGVDWKVTHAKPGFWGLKDRTGETKILPAPPTGARVEILHLTPVELEEMLRVELGAELEGVMMAGETVYSCPPFEDKNLPEMKSHLFMMHGVATISVNDPGNSAGMNSKPKLIEAHEAAHAKPIRDRWLPHVHVPHDQF